MSVTETHKTEIVTPPKPYKAPTCEVGQLVYWYPHGSQKNPVHAAFVTKIGHDSVCLNIMHPNTYNFMVRDGVRHFADPRAKQAELVEQGGWGHTPATERLQMLEEHVANLTKLCA